MTEGLTSTDRTDRLSVLVNLVNERNESLLREFLTASGAATTVDAGTDERVDLYVVDSTTLDDVVDDLRARKADQRPLFLPCLVIDETHGRRDPLRTVDPADHSLVDEVISAPVRKHELRRRVDSLLRARALSLELADSQQQYRGLVELLPAGVFLVRDDRILYANDTARSMVGADRPLTTDDATAVTADGGALVGDPFTSLVVDDESPVVRRYVDAVANGEDDPLVDTAFLSATLRDRDGNELATELAGVPVTYEGEPAVQVLVRDVTERDQREERLRLYRRAMDEARIGITISDARAPDEPLVYVNDEFVDLTGRSREELLGQNPRILQCDDTDEATVGEIRAAIDDERPVSTVILNERADGTRWYNRLEIFPVGDGDGEVTHYIGFQQDVTEERRQREELETTRAELAATLERISDAFFTLDTDWQFTHVNDRAEVVLDRSADELIGQNVWDAFPEAVTREFYDEYHRAMADQETVAFEEYYPPLDAWFDVSAYPDEDGLSVYFRDVTDRKRRENLFEHLHDATERLQAAETTDDVCRIAVETLRDTLGLAQTACWLRDGDTLSLRAATGDEAAETDSELDGTDPEWTAFSEGVATELSFDDRPDRAVDDRLLFPLGEHGLLGASDPDRDAYPDALLDAGRVLGGHVVSALERVARQEALRERERDLSRYETFFQTAGDPIYTLDEDGRFVTANDAMASFTGYDREELLGSHASLVFPPSDVARSERVIDDLVAAGEGTRTVELHLETATGDVRLCEATIALLPAEDDQRGTVGVLRDLTDHRQREQRLAVLDRVLRHNLRNKLNVAVGHLQTVEGASEADAASLRAIEETIGELLALSEEARTFRDTVEADADIGTVDLVPVLGAAVADLRSEHHGVSVSLDLPDAAPAYAYDSIELAFNELLENAVLHTDGDPAIDVSISFEGPDDRWAVVSVADDGPGIPTEERSVFVDQGETTLHHGSGIGLWIVRWTVEKSGGSVAAETDGDGTVVRVALRRASDGGDDVPSHPPGGLHEGSFEF